MPKYLGQVEWIIQAVGTGVLSDTMPLDLGVLHADLTTDGTTLVIDENFTDRLMLALAAFRAVMNEGKGR